MLFGESEVTNNVSEEVMQEMGVFRRYFESINWQQVVSSILLTLLQILAILIIFGIAKKVGNYFIDLTFKRRIKKSESDIPNRKNTLHRLSQNVFNAVAYFFLVFAILESIGIPVGSLIAGAGIIGLALSLGAQDFVADIVNGFMILMEKQIDIGEQVEIGEILGIVVDVNLKTTIIKGFDGAIYYVPNREITVISNRSRADMRAQIQIRLFPETDLQAVRDVVTEVNNENVPNYEQITSAPELIFVPMDNGQLAAQITMFTEAGEEYGTKMEFYEKYMAALTQAGIEVPSNALDLNTTA